MKPIDFEDYPIQNGRLIGGQISTYNAQYNDLKQYLLIYRNCIYWQGDESY